MGEPNAPNATANTPTGVTEGPDVAELLFIAEAEAARSAVYRERLNAESGALKLAIARVRDLERELDIATQRLDAVLERRRGASGLPSDASLRERGPWGDRCRASAVKPGQRLLRRFWRKAPMMSLHSSRSYCSRPPCANRGLTRFQLR